jgi:hypothetical protein
MRMCLWLLMSVVASGCAPAWNVVRSSSPPALAGQTDVAVAFDYSKMSVEGRLEPEWVKLKSAEETSYAATWSDVKGRFEGAVLEGLRLQFPGTHPVQSGPGSPTVTVVVHSFTLGQWVPFSMPTVIEVSLSFRVAELVTDEINLVRSHPPSLNEPSVFTHVPHVGVDIGRAGGRFLASKQR